MKSARAGNLSKAQRFAQFHGGGITYVFGQLNDLYFLITEKFVAAARTIEAGIKTPSAADGGFSRRQTVRQGVRASVISGTGGSRRLEFGFTAS